MGSPVSVADGMTNQLAAGDYSLMYAARTQPSTTLATATSGGITTMRYDAVATVPAGGGGYVKDWRAAANATWMMPALEVIGGSFTIGGAYAAGSALPSRKILGGSGVAQQLGTTWAFLHIDTTFTGGTFSTVVITYTNEKGVGSRTATLVLGVNPKVGSAFRITPHLQSGDLGIRSIQNISQSGQTGGAMSVRLAFPLGLFLNAALSGGFSQGVAPMNWPQPLLLPNDTIATYRPNTSTTTSSFCTLIIGPEV